MRSFCVKKPRLITPGCVTLLLIQHMQDNNSMTLNTGGISTKVFYPAYNTKVSNRRFRVQQQMMKRLETERKQNQTKTKTQTSKKPTPNLWGKRWRSCFSIQAERKAKLQAGTSPGYIWMIRGFPPLKVFKNNIIHKLKHLLKH